MFLNMQYLINKAVQVIIELYDPDEIILFGSYAKGDENLHSDIDLLIIKSTPLLRQNRGLDIILHLKRYPQKFDLLFYTPLEILEKKQASYSFINSILISGISMHKKL